MSDASIEAIDTRILQSWMDARNLGSGDIQDISFIAGGTQNMLMRFRREADVYVLRRPPMHKRPNSDETMRREARVLGALRDTDVPHPRLIAAESDENILGAAFYLMECVDGFNANLEMPEPHRSDPSVQHAMGLSMADAIAALSRIDPAAVGILNLGKADGWIERQAPRWRSHLETYNDFDNYDGADIGDVDMVSSWLTRHAPLSMQVGIIHGDFHFSNVLMRRDKGELVAIVDWELATIGDPLLDLAHLLVTWPGNSTMRSPSLEGVNLPTPDEVIDHYALRTNRDMTHLVWFRVLAAYRLGIILEGTNARAGAGLAPRETGTLLHETAVSLIEHASTLISQDNS